MLDIHFCMFFLFQHSSMRVVEFGRTEWTRVKFHVSNEIFEKIRERIKIPYKCEWTESQTKWLLRRLEVYSSPYCCLISIIRLQLEIRLAWSYPEVESIMYQRLGFAVNLVKIDPESDSKAAHEISFYGFIPIRLTYFEK